MTLVKTIFVLSILSSISVSYSDENKNESCSSGAQPILSAADFNGDSIVNDADIKILKSVLKREQYYAFYDINADGKLNGKDHKFAEQQLNSQSTKFDQQLAKLFHQVKQYQITDTKEEVTAMGFNGLTPTLSGHGEHWTNLDGGKAIAGYGSSEFYRAEGLNISKDTNRVHGLFWGVAAQPVFENGATDYPQAGGEWMNSQVVAFTGHSPKFTASENEMWHAHSGLCVTSELTESGETFSLNQHTTFLECQAIPSNVKSISNPGLNNWINIWMLHTWMFDLNPNGIFANEHPCIDPTAPPESSINGDKEIPPFFQHHGG